MPVGIEAGVLVRAGGGQAVVPVVRVERDEHVAPRRAWPWPQAAARKCRQEGRRKGEAAGWRGAGEPVRTQHRRLGVAREGAEQRRGGGGAVCAAVALSLEKTQSEPAAALTVDRDMIRVHLEVELGE